MNTRQKKKFKRAASSEKSGTILSATVLPNPVKSESDKKTYKVIRLANQLTALLVSDGPDLYNIDDFYNVSSDESSVSGSSDSEIDDDPAYESCETLEFVKNDKFAACALSVNVGGFCDPVHIPGLAHFLEHMVFMGSARFPKENYFDVFVQKHGGSTNAMTSGECTTFHFDCNVRYLFKALNIFSQFFIAPLLKRESMVREREAIDSEFQLATASDSARLEQLVASFASDENPSGKFLWGNLKTLRDGVTDDVLYDELRKFHRQYYSANLMTLSILAKIPLSTLENCALECFSDVPNYNIPRPKFKITKPLFERQLFHRMYYVHSVKDVTKLLLMWQLPSLKSAYETKPDELISWLLAHEGEGSLLSYLKSKLWALGLWGGVTRDSTYMNDLYSLFRVEISLSEAGYAHLRDVIAAVFGYVRLMMRSAGGLRRAYDEMKQLTDLDFRFQEEKSTTEFVENVVELMHIYPSAEYFRGPIVFYRYDAGLVNELMTHLTVDAVNVMVRAKEFKDGPPIDKVEPWFETKYGSKEIDPEWLKLWNTVEPYNEFRLPLPNRFISRKFVIIEPGASDGQYPVNVLNNNSMEIWYKLDTTFKLPIASINLHFVSPLGLESIKSAIMIDLFTRLIEYQLMEEVYPAALAQLSYNIDTSARGGMLLKFYGFDHKLPSLVELVIAKIASFTSTVLMFQTIMKELKKDYRNRLLKRTDLVQELRYSLIEQPYYATSSKYAACDTVTFDELLVFVKKFFTSAYVQCLVQGNMTKERAIQVCRTAVRTFGESQMPKRKLPYVRIRRIPVGEKCVLMKSFNKLDYNSVVANYYQWGMVNMQKFVELEMLVKLMEEKIFNVLRTKEQLGYDVYTSFRNSFGIVGFIITVHFSSAKFSAHFVEERIARFLDSFATTLSSMRLDEFNKERESFIKTKSVVYDNLKQEVEHNLREIGTEEYMFDRRFREVDYLQNVRLQHIRNTFLEMMKMGSDRYRRLSVQVVGYENQEEAELAVNDNPSFGVKLIKGEKNDRDYYVTDLDQFKNQLMLYPKAKILDDRKINVRLNQV